MAKNKKAAAGKERVAAVDHDLRVIALDRTMELLGYGTGVEGEGSGRIPLEGDIEAMLSWAHTVYGWITEDPETLDYIREKVEEKRNKEEEKPAEEEKKEVGLSDDPSQGSVVA
jgi:cyclophilin family peptidyl-prolyl cis-trans isomerase